MAQILVRNIEPEVKERLRQLAVRHGRSMEEEARDILRDAVKREARPAGGLGTEIAELFRGTGPMEEIPELRGHPVEPAKFDE